MTAPNNASAPVTHKKTPPRDFQACSLLRRKYMNLHTSLDFNWNLALNCGTGSTQAAQIRASPVMCKGIQACD